MDRGEIIVYETKRARVDVQVYLDHGIVVPRTSREGYRYTQ